MQAMTFMVPPHTADFDVDIEHTLQALRPAHRCPALDGVASSDPDAFAL